MSLLFTMLPIYLFGNLHCIGMCGPLVMMLGHHRFRYLYFLGRALSFTLTGMLAGGAGEVLNIFLQQYHLSALVSFFFGGVIAIIGIYSLLGWQYPGHHWLSKRLAKFNNTLSLLIMQNKAWPTFLFGFFTVTLPCGQTVLVFSACALSGDLWVGALNGFAFALLTSPSLFLAMKAKNLLSSMKKSYHTILGVSAIVVGALSLCRGLAEVDVISHWTINPNAPSHYHIVIF